MLARNVGILLRASALRRPTLYCQSRCFSCCAQNARESATVQTSHQILAAADPHEFKDGPSLAVIGSGPAGFYMARKVMRELPGTKVDMYEQLPVPFGLVRFGVAPDHPEVKNCQDEFQEVAEARNFNFIGNIHLGQELPLQTLVKHYDAIVFAYGASKDSKIGLKGEDKPHIYSARAFVGWYNGLPEYRDLKPDLQAGDTAIIVGQGNVALDVARTLLSKTENLKKTDMTAHAIETLSQSTTKHVHVVGRRGPMQAAFTIKEIRELLHLEDVNFKPIPEELFPPDIAKLPRPKRRIMELLKKGSPDKPDATKSWSLDFLLAPTGLQWSDKDPDRLVGATFVRTRLADPTSTTSKVQTTDQTLTIPASTFLRSIGYKAEPIAGMVEIGVEFDDERGTLQHDGSGRITALYSSTSGKPGLYCAGWVKRGPTGVIASTMTDAFETAEAIVRDWKDRATQAEGAKSGARAEGAEGAESVQRARWAGVLADAEKAGLKLNPVHWDGWKTIDAAEKKEGQLHGKPREKMGTVAEMLNAAGSSLAT